MIRVETIDDKSMEILLAAFNSATGFNYTKEDFIYRVKNPDFEHTCDCCLHIFNDPENPVELVVLEDGTRVCPECMKKYFFTCPDCGTLHHVDDDTFTVDEGLSTEHRVCRSCIGNVSKYFRSNYDGKHYSMTYLNAEFAAETGIKICIGQEVHYEQCAECGDWCRSDDLYTDNGQRICSECYHNRPHHSYSYIYSYSTKPNAIFHHVDEEVTKRYMGVELETAAGENANEQENFSEDLYDLSDGEKLFYQKMDSSIGSDGIEIVTHPCSARFMLDKFPWESITSAARSNRYISHQGGRCGLHVHVSRAGLGEDTTAQEGTIAKIVLLVDRFWDNILRFTRRSSDSIDRWARKPNADIIKGDNLKSAIDKCKNALAYDRYRAVNLENRNTIEFRIFRGTLNVNTIKATIQFVDRLCEYAMTHTVDECLDHSWEDMIGDAPQELRTYLDQRHLSHL